MPKRYLLILSIAIAAFTFSGCSKKNHPARSSTTDENNTSLRGRKNDSLLERKPVVKQKEKVVIPKVIIVNDSAARKSVDGRYYYDVMGHRYWRNNKDGKYYLFDKSMYTNDAFKKPG